MTAKEISKVLYKSKMKSGGIVVQNYFYNGFEADLLHVKDNMLFEYEIKVSRADFFKDFEKKDKHEKMQGGKMANRFYFVVPTCMIKIAEVPAMYGLIYVNDLGQISTIKRAKELHKDLINTDFYANLARNLMFRLQSEKIKYEGLKSSKYGKQLEL
jgi:hypothetical protein